MPFDLKAATDAATTEAERAPFEFEWDGDKFSLPPLASWPIGISAAFAELGAADDDADIDPAEVIHMLKAIVGEDWPRFSAIVPMGAMPILLTEMSKQQLGGSTADLSPRPEPASTQT